MKSCTIGVFGTEVEEEGGGEPSPRQLGDPALRAGASAETEVVDLEREPTACLLDSVFH